MSWVRLSLFTVLLTFATGCADQARVATLEKRTAELESTVKSLKDSVDRLDREKSFDQFIREAESVAYLTPGSEGYSVIQMDLGHMTVMLHNVQAYANGTRITLRLGNLTSATINGAKAKLEWGRVDAKGTPDNDNARSREVSLRAGAWTEVNVALEGVPPAEFGFVRVREMTHTGIALR